MGIMSDQFHCFASLPHSFASYFVTLIPKVNSPSHLRCFMHMSLHTLAGKVLVTSLGPVMDKLISHNQRTFLKGEILVDGVMGVNEMVDLAKRTKRICLFLKVDFEEAYDLVSWNFLDNLWRIEAIVKDFEMYLGLRVNFFKSSLI